MEKLQLVPFTLDTFLTGYMPVPRELLNMDLPGAAVLIYGLLLDRGTLSRKNRYADETGQVYVIYPVLRLAETLHISDTAVKRHLRELEDRGLIRRCRPGRLAPSHIYLNLPSGSHGEPLQEPEGTSDGPEKTRWKGRKVPPNNRRKQPEYSNPYQHREDESL